MVFSSRFRGAVIGGLRTAEISYHNRKLAV
jgi:hypothetical protein